MKNHEGQSVAVGWEEYFDLVELLVFAQQLTTLEVSYFPC